MTKRQRRQKKARIKRWLNKRCGSFTKPTNKQGLQRSLRKANKQKSIITDKHDPFKLATYPTTPGQRTVVSHELAPQLIDVINAGQFELTVFENTLHGNMYYLMEFPVSVVSVPASGVACNSDIPIDQCDSIVAVHGKNQGWHVFGEYSKLLPRKNYLKNPRKLK
jgi:hypothetical protein